MRVLRDHFIQYHDLENESDPMREIEKPCTYRLANTAEDPAAIRTTKTRTTHSFTASKQSVVLASDEGQIFIWTMPRLLQQLNRTAVLKD